MLLHSLRACPVSFGCSDGLRHRRPSASCNCDQTKACLVALRRLYRKSVGTLMTCIIPAMTRAFRSCGLLCSLLALLYQTLLQHLRICLSTRPYPLSSPRPCYGSQRLLAWRNEWLADMTKPPPSEWHVADIFLVLKPGKKPTAAALRPISLLHPVAKALATMLKCRVQPAVDAFLNELPQYAYMQQRSAQDALARAFTHCTFVQALLRTQTLHAAGSQTRSYCAPVSRRNDFKC